MPPVRRVSRFRYTIPHRKGSGFCDLHLLKTKSGVVVFLQDRKDNHGYQSPTNAIEHIADQACAKFKIEPKRLTLIEGPPPQFRRRDVQETWNVVTFRRKGGRFVEPSWRPLDGDAWASLFAAATGAKFG